MAWSATFDFVFSDHDWTNDATGLRPFGIYNSSIGWQSVFGTVGATDDERLYLRKEIATTGPVIETVEVFYTVTGTTGPAGKVVGIVVDAFTGTDTYTSPSVFTHLETGIGITIVAATAIRTSFVGGESAEGALDATITKIIVTGTGDNPFPSTANLIRFIPNVLANGAGASGIASTSQDGANIYIAAANNLGTPILIKIASDLATNGTIVLDPGDGDRIGVECGRFDENVVWVAGNFGGTNVVEKSENAGSSFAVKDDATIGVIRAFRIGPNDDETIIVFDETNGDILETIDDGATWITINASVSPEINAIARLDVNPEESVFGNVGGATDSIDYSVNSGADLEDFQTGVFPNADVTGVIVN